MDCDINIFDAINMVKKQIIFYLTRSSVCNFENNLIKVHRKNLSKIGEFGFPLSAFIWRKYGYTCGKFYNENKTNIFSCELNREFNAEDEIQRMKSDIRWYIPIDSIIFESEKCFIFLNKEYTYSCVLAQIFEKECYKQNIDLNSLGDGKDTECMNLFSYRSLLIKLTTKNMLSFAVICQEILNDFDKVEFTCGAVVDPRTGKAAALTVKDYNCLRSTDMQLIAMHKYGVRERGEVRLHDLISQLGNAAVKIDLLEIKHTSSVNIVRNGQGSTKGAAFILYNSARLQTLLRKFKEKVQAGIYPPLPVLNEVDFLLLKEEEEWRLFFVYVVQFPNMVQRCLKDMKSGCIGLHLLIQFLQGLVSLFSIYYHRIQILTEHRSQLMPKVYARIYLLKALQTILNISLSFLNIKPIEYM